MGSCTCAGAWRSVRVRCGSLVCLFVKIGGLRKRPRLRYGFVVARVGGAGAGARDVRRGGELCAESGE